MRASHLVVLAAVAATTLFARPSEAVKVTFRFSPPEAAEVVSVAGTFNDWNPAATLLADADGDGTWETILDLPPGRHLYKFVVNGNTWFTDETASEFVDDGFGGKNSVLLLGEEPVVVGVPEAAAAVPAGTPVTFRYRCDDLTVNSVSVAGSFNDWNAAAHPLSDEDGDGVWEVTLRLEPGEHACQFVLDGEHWVGGPDTGRTTEDGFGGRSALLTVEDTPIVVGP